MTEAVVELVETTTIGKRAALPRNNPSCGRKTQRSLYEQEMVRRARGSDGDALRGV